MIYLKSDEEIKIMAEGGNILNEVMEKLLKTVDIGMEMIELDRLAESEIIKRGAKPSFKTVPGYRWTICACVNDIVVHGVPGTYKAKKNDIIGIDLGIYFKGFHTDCSWTIRVGGYNKKNNHPVDEFLQCGQIALDRALKTVQPDNYIFDISRAIQNTVEQAGYSVVKNLIGHGIGKKLHEEPEIPGFVSKPRKKTTKIVPGLTVAVEVIYNLGSGEVDYIKEDGWTIKTRDGKISGLFETTVAVTNHGVILLTKKYGPSGDN